MPATAVAAPRHAPAGLIDVLDHLDWAERIGAAVAREYRFSTGTADWEDLRAFAVVTVCAKAAKYDPARCPPGGDHGGAFRGWCHPTVKSECIREAKRLRNGGTYHTRRDEATLPPVRVESLDALRTPAGDPVEVACHRTRPGGAADRVLVPGPGLWLVPRPADDTDDTPPERTAAMSAAAVRPSPLDARLRDRRGQLAAAEVEVQNLEAIRKLVSQLRELTVPDPKLRALAVEALQAPAA